LVRPLLQRPPGARLLPYTTLFRSELTKHVSLLQLDPKALLQLRTAGTCTFTLPEELFDLGTPGHYFRRIKSVALSVASVTGPYTDRKSTRLNSSHGSMSDAVCCST